MRARKRARTRGNSAVATNKVNILCKLSNFVPNSFLAMRKFILYMRMQF